jgi:queuosine precursor transporter
MPQDKPDALPRDLRPGAMDTPSGIYLWLAAVFVTCLVLANVVGVKLFRVQIDLWGAVVNVEHTAGLLIFPITFLLTDLLNEYYGKTGARRVTYLAFAMAALAFVLIWLSREIPILEGIPNTATALAYENIFGAASAMYIASIVAFLCGSLLDIFIFGLFKKLTRGRLVWLRATGSTVISQLFDSFVVCFIFFWFIPLLMGDDRPGVAWVVRTALTGYILKFVIAVALTPFIYLGRWTLREKFGLTPVPVESPEA